MSGQTLKWLSVIDEFTRELLILKVDRSITSEDVIDSLAKLIAYRGVPRAIRGDNGPEFVARSIRDWLARLGVSTLYIEPGSPWQNGYAESFHSRLRDEFLRVEVFPSLREAQSLTATWQHDYNTVRPHGSIEGMTPAMFADRWAASASSRLGGSLPRTSHRTGLVDHTSGSSSCHLTLQTVLVA